MLSPSNAAEQLRAAQVRIASLEQELAVLRSATPSPVPPPVQTIHKVHRAPQSLKPRPSVVTRRASAAAAAAAAVTAVASDLTRARSRKVYIAPKPTMPAASMLPLSSDLLRSAEDRPTPRSPCRHAPPECSEVSREGSELSSSVTPGTIPSDDLQTSASMETASLAPSSDTSPRSSSQPSTGQLIEAPTPNVPSPQLIDLQQAHASVGQRPSSSTPSVTGVPASRTGSPVLSESAAEAQTPKEAGKAGPADLLVQRRRPPPLPVVKTACTKKERVNLVAKCTEPKPGQTRYWTEEEHERFLVAVAEYGEKAYVGISNYVETRTPKQVRTHAQKFQMKMARLARQSIEAGEPVQMPAGMSPVVQVSNSDGPGLSGQVPVVITTAPPAKLQAEKAISSTPALRQLPALASGMKEIGAATLTDESSPALTDPYLDYIGAAADPKVDMELETAFAANLCQNLEVHVAQGKVKDEKFLITDEASTASAEIANEDDDLEDLDKLEDGDLALAAFTNAAEGWLLPDITS